MSDKPLPMRPGDPVTLLLPDHVVMVEVDTSTRTEFAVVLSSRTEKAYTSKWKLEAEGVDWLRGYHLADSPEVKACRTAQALTSKEPAGGVPVRPTNPSGIPTSLIPNQTYGPIGPVVSGGGGGGGGVVSQKEVKGMLQQLLEEQAKAVQFGEHDAERKP